MLNASRKCCRAAGGTYVVAVRVNHQINAAVGYLNLDMADEALLELEAVGHEHQGDPTCWQCALPCLSA